MADREKALSDDKHKQLHLEIQKQKVEEPVLPPQPVPSVKPKKAKKNKKNKKKSKKRKNHSSQSESSSDSDNSDSAESDQDPSRSIRVAMRNKTKGSSGNDDKIKSPWPTGVHYYQSSPRSDGKTPENERQALHPFHKLKSKQEESKNLNEAGSLDNKNGSFGGQNVELDAWGPKEPPKSFWIKKDEDKNQSLGNKPLEASKTDEMPKPHMGFWTKQQVSVPLKSGDGGRIGSADSRDDPKERARSPARSRSRER